MICKECQKEGKESKVYSGMCSVTAMYRPPYYDEKGVYHNHDPNWYCQNYRCSNGHEWYESHLTPCPNCDYGKEE